MFISLFFLSCYFFRLPSHRSRSHSLHRRCHLSWSVARSLVCSPLVGLRVQGNVWAVNILTPGHFNKITSKNYKRHLYFVLCFVFPFWIYLNCIRCECVYVLFDSSFLPVIWITHCIQIVIVVYVTLALAKWQTKPHLIRIDFERTHFCVTRFHPSREDTENEISPLSFCYESSVWPVIGLYSMEFFFYPMFLCWTDAATAAAAAETATEEDGDEWKESSSIHYLHLNIILNFTHSSHMHTHTHRIQRRGVNGERRNKKKCRATKTVRQTARDRAKAEKPTAFNGTTRR